MDQSKKEKGIVLVGTAKGLLELTKENSLWKISKDHFRGLPVSCVYEHPTTGRWWVGINHRHWGQKLYVSDDSGNSWQEYSVPSYPATAQLSNGKAAVLKKIWCLQAADDNSDAMWMGTEPGGLFYSPTKDAPFELVESLWSHPSREDGNQWFGAGRDHPFIHSIVVDPRNPNQVYVAVSCAGVFKTEDGGKNWFPKNNGLISAYLPNPNVEIGHDPHLVLQCKSSPSILWQQNHCGIFRSTNGGEDWSLVSDENKIPHYGFSLVIDNNNPMKAWVIPSISDLERVPSNLALTVHHTSDGGKSWKAQREGLPQEYCYDLVYRHAFAKKNQVLVFGTANGNLYLSEDEGYHWQSISTYLARVETICFAGNTLNP
ncbi:MAG: WD40/YVTN/BNR-like repeat-containing protein [Saprospiraceae bacterium]